MSADRTKLEPFFGDVIAGSGDQSRLGQSPGEGTLAQLPMVPGERETMQRNDELRLEVGDKTAEGLVLRANGAPLTPSMDEWDVNLAAGHVKYRGWCLLCVVSHSMSWKDTLPLWIAGKLVGIVIWNGIWRQNPAEVAEAVWNSQSVQVWSR